MAPASAQSAAIPPGHEAFFSSLLGPADGRAADTEQLADVSGDALALPAGCAFEGASILIDHVDARYRCDGSPVELRLTWQPSGERVGDERVTVQALSGEASDALVAVLVRRADANASRLPWKSVESRARPVRELVTWAFLLLGILAAVFAVAVGRFEPRAAFRRHRAALLLVAIFIGAAALVPDAGPIHPHRSFIARSDTARDPVEDQGVIGWMPPAFHVYGLLFEHVPYRLKTLTTTSVLLSALALFLLSVLVRRLTERARLLPSNARDASLLAIVFTGFHPAFLRLSVATSFWPWVAVALFASAIATLGATETRGRAQLAWTVAASVFFSLAVASSLAMLAVLPLVLIAPLVWRLRRKSRRGVVLFVLALAIVAAFIGPYAREAVLDALYAQTTLVRAPSEQIQVAFANAIYAVPSLTPVPLALMALLGLAWTFSSPRVFAPFVLAAFSTELLLGPLDPWDFEFPVRLLHGQLSLFFAGAFAAWGAVALRDFVRRKWRDAARFVLPALGVAIVATLPLSHDALFLLSHAQSHTLEARRLSEALPRLPPHDTLVVGPVRAERISDVDFSGDPIELVFPLGEHAAVSAERGYFPRVITIDEALVHPPEGVTLFYLGLSLVSWDPHEIAVGVVSEDLERPPLHRLRERFVLEPLETFEVPNVEHPSTLARPYADRERSHTLGFYRLHRRPR